MASRTPVEITTPPGSRLVFGDVHKARPKTNRDGTPKLNADGTPQTSFDFGIAVAKAGTTHWSQTPMGALILAEGRAGYGALADRPDFSWKTIDGDSTVPNKKGNRPCDQDGYPGHWIFVFSSMGAPQKYSVASGQPVLDASEEISQPGDYVQVLGSVVCNHGKNGQAAESPGVYLNHRGVCYGGRHPAGRITSQAPVNASLFGAVPGASFAPTAGIAPAPAPTPAVVAPAPVAVTPNAGIMPTPPAPPQAPAAPAPERRASLGGNSWPLSEMLAGGWTEATLLSGGYTIG